MENIAPALLDWFYKNHRILPFRTDPSPYHVWLSEIMLQQTRVSAALPYYERFLAALPDIPALAGCEEEKLHKLWEGLGYYSRVRNLQKAAKLVCAQYSGQLPADYAALRALPGIGEYTAGAIASISFGLPVPAVDGNVLRVFSRLYNDPGVITEPTVKKAFTARVMEHQPPEKAGDYNQALMELGALVCVPNGAPLCGQCPLAEVCLARAAGTTAQLPQKAKPKPRKIVPVTLALVESPAGFLVQQRPAKGLLAGLWQPVLWEDEHLLQAEVLARLTALGLDTTGLLLALLVTQIVAFPSALIFGRLSAKYPSSQLIPVCIAAYAGIALFAFFLKHQWQFWVLAVVVGMFQGGIQALSRSHFAKIIPPEKSGEYFGLFDICGKGASFLGTMIVSVGSQLTGSANVGVGSLIVLFIVGFVLFRVSDQK